MSLLGQAAMLLTFDVEKAAIAEHDDWHTHEHLPERLSIPGFLRGTRWVAVRGAPRYVVLYEVDRLETLGSRNYLERLNDPTPWTSKMMTYYRGMSRGLCSVEKSCGPGMGHFALLIRFKPASDSSPSVAEWLSDDVMPRLPARPGLGSVHLLRSALAPAMTSEQRIRGADTGVDWALLATGYEQDTLANLEQAELSAGELEGRGASSVVSALYQLAYSVLADEVGARPRGQAGV
jgi:hypothetical protein